MVERIHLRMSGRNNGTVERTVYRVDWARSIAREVETEIGRVVPVTHADGQAWEAIDMQGRSEGNRWLTDWYAAEALPRGTNYVPF